MTRGTTPDLEITLTGVDVTTLTSLYITINQTGETVLEKTLDDVTIVDDVIHVAFTQEETLTLTAREPIAVQARGITDSGAAFATNIRRLPVRPILKDGVIE